MKLHVITIIFLLIFFMRDEKSLYKIYFKINFNVIKILYNYLRETKSLLFLVTFFHIWNQKTYSYIFKFIVKSKLVIRIYDYHYLLEIKRYLSSQFLLGPHRNLLIYICKIIKIFNNNNNNKLIQKSHKRLVRLSNGQKLHTSGRK